MHNMSKIKFSSEDIAEAVSSFVANNAPRIAVGFGKNSDVAVYGENTNKRKPTLAEEDNDGEVQNFTD